MQDSVSGVSYC